MKVSERIWRADVPMTWSDAVPPCPADSLVMAQAFVRVERHLSGVDAWYLGVRGRVGPTPFPSEALEVE